MSEPAPRPPIASAPLSVILFAQALSAEQSDALSAWQRHLESQRRPYEILLIQENHPETVPPDVPPETPPHLRMFTYDRAAGFREAVSAALAAAQHPLIAFSTCDQQYQPQELERLLKMIDNVDLVVGFRTGGQPPQWRLLLDTFNLLFCRIILGIPVEPRRCWLGRAGWGRRWVSRWIFGVRVQDPECPFRLGRREIFTRWPIQSRGPFVQIEMLAKANHLTCLMAEEGVSWTPPAVPIEDAISFGQDAWAIFGSPDFGSYVPPPPDTPPQILPSPPT
jgi:hypothetical protein